MIKLSQKIKISWTKNNRKHYESKGYIFKNFGDSFEISVEDLPEGSHTKVNIICDYCGEEIVKEYRYHSKEDCCVKCRKEKSNRQI